jgi:hypothetical protein
VQWYYVTGSTNHNVFDVGTYEKDDEDDTSERVNCLTGRPSSAYIVTNESPSIWFKPLEVFEVSFADLSLSRAHTAGARLVDDPDGRGIALGFPRFKRRRPDKSIEQATTTEEVAHLFYEQKKSYKFKVVMSTISIPACHAPVASPLGLACQLVTIPYVIYNSRLRYLVDFLDQY